MIRLCVATCCAVALAACSLPGTASTTASSASPQQHTSQPSPTPGVVGTVRTVLSPLGLNLHAQPSTTASVLAVAGQGAALTVQAYQPSGDGWYEVQGQSVTGWIIADPTLTAEGSFTPFNSDYFSFGVLYPDSWAFSQQSGGVVFRPQRGSQSIMVRVAASPSAFGAVPAGYAQSSTAQEIVCGYTGQLNEYMLANGQPAPSPFMSGVHMLERYADIRLSFDVTHAMDLSYEYSAQGDLGLFADFYNSLVVPYPLCQAPQSPAPSQPVPT